MSETHLSNSLSRLRGFGYIASERHPLNGRVLIHRVIYDEADRYQIRDLLESRTGTSDVTDQDEIGHEWPSDRSQMRVEQVTTQIAKSLSDEGKRPLIYSNRNNKREEEEERAAAIEGSEKRYSAEAGTSDEGVNSQEVENYLSEVEAFASDPLTLAAVKCECPKLSEIIDNVCLPEELRTRAASLIGVARDMA